MEQSPLASVLGHLAQTAELQTQLQQAQNEVLVELARSLVGKRGGDFVESTATSPPPHLSLMLLHPRHLFHHPRHPFQEESAREQARHEESEAKLAEW
ncbi:unnamed protein product [Boreogadus saida]